MPLAQVLADWAGRLVLDAGIADGMEARRTMLDARVALGMKARRAVLVTDAADGMVPGRAAAQADVSAIAARFGGGGHAQAAGATIHAVGPEAVRLFLQACEDVLD